MKGSGFQRGDADSVRLRTLIATIDRELSLVPRLAMGDGVRATDPLRRSWAELVDLLALGPAPEVRQCPVCNHFGMRAATRCGYCWTKLSPLAAAASSGPGAPALG
jgi:hypothetical protein